MRVGYAGRGSDKSDLCCDEKVVCGGESVVVCSSITSSACLLIK